MREFALTTKDTKVSDRFRISSIPNFVLLVLHCYPKTNTNMFVIACGINIPGVDDSLIRIFLSPRRKDAK